MEFKNRENKRYFGFEPTGYERSGVEIFHSRSVAVATIVMDLAANILLSKRSAKMQEAGKFCLPCGYLDWDETTEEAAAREVWEETGLDISPGKGYKLDNFFVEDASNLDYNRSQHVIFYFFCRIFEEVPEVSSESKEVEEVLWVPIGDIIEPAGKFLKNGFAFGHREIILNHFDKYINIS